MKRATTIFMIILTSVLMLNANTNYFASEVVENTDDKYVISDETSEHQMLQSLEFSLVESDFVEGKFNKIEKVKIPLKNISDGIISIKEEDKVKSKSTTLKSNNTYYFEINNIEDGDSMKTLEISQNGVINHEVFYIYSTFDSYYISRLSANSARRLCFLEMLDNQIIEEAEHDNFVYGNDSIEIVNSSYQTRASGWLTVAGEIKFRDRNGIVHPARGVKVEIRDKEPIGSTLMRTIYTDSNDYVFETYLRENMPDGDYYGYDLTFNNNDDRGRAFMLHQSLMVGEDYMNNYKHFNTGNLNVKFPVSGTTASYSPSSNTINIPITKYDYPDVILHEYGHYIQNFIGFSNNPGGSHTLHNNHSDATGNKSSGVRLAWAEGWATFFGTMAQFETNSLGLGIPDMGDLVYTSWSGTRESGYRWTAGVETCGSSHKGEACECSIYEFLWDLADNYNPTYAHDSNYPRNETHDKISLGFNKVWDIILTIMPNTLSEFMVGVYNYIGTSPSVDFNRLGMLLEFYNIGPKLASPADLSFASIKTAPTLSWTGTGGSTSFPHNEFIVRIYNERYQLKYTVNVGNSMSYTLTTSQWEELLNDSTCSSFYWTVQSNNTNSPWTGGYYSTQRRVGFPEISRVYDGTVREKELENVGDCHWFRFVAPSAGEYEFFSTGTTDTYVEFFTRVVIGQSTSYRFDYDDDDGSGNNFYKKLNLTSGQTIYIRVRGYGWSRIGEYEFNSRRFHEHEYIHYGMPTNHYKNCNSCGSTVNCSLTATVSSYTSSKHTYSCSCGFSFQENHQKYTSGSYQYCSIAGCDWSQLVTHSHTLTTHIPAGNYMGMSRHTSYCACGYSKLMACLGMMMDPNLPVYCLQCGQEMGNGGIGMLYSIELPNGMIILYSEEVSQEYAISIYLHYYEVNDNTIYIENNLMGSVFHKREDDFPLE